MTRDTATHKPLTQAVFGISGRMPSLKKLAQRVLGKSIQMGEHSSLEDARAVMLIFNRYKHQWKQCDYLTHL